MHLKGSSVPLQAVEQYETLRSREAEQATELDGARDEAKAAISAFNDLAGRRFDLFMAAFDHVAAHIDPIFKARHDVWHAALETAPVCCDLAHALRGCCSR